MISSKISITSRATPSSINYFRKCLQLKDSSHSDQFQMRAAQTLTLQSNKREWSCMDPPASFITATRTAIRMNSHFWESSNRWMTFSKIISSLKTSCSLQASDQEPLGMMPFLSNSSQIGKLKLYLTRVNKRIIMLLRIKTKWKNSISSITLNKALKRTKSKLNS